MVSTGSSPLRSAAALASSASYWAASNQKSGGTAVTLLVFSQASRNIRMIAHAAQPHTQFPVALGALSLGALPQRAEAEGTLRG